MKEYTDKQINSMILHLRLNNVAEMYYIENQDDSDRNFFCYRSQSYLKKSQVIALAIETGWKEKEELSE
tara:strand:- start:195 stop:401 length:207 start_codon:yes stop_codon:yes gene_type:complete